MGADIVNKAIIGLGWQGEIITSLIRKSHTGLEIDRAVDVDAQRSQAFQDKYGIPVSPSYEAVLEDPSIDAVTLATPHQLHETQVTLAASAGKHVFCEKPLGMTWESSRRAVACCQQANVVLGVGPRRRFESPMVKIREMLNNGALGQVLQIEANFSHDKFISLDRDNWRLSAQQEPAGGDTAYPIPHQQMLSTIAVLEGVFKSSQTSGTPTRL